ncbi:MAG: hypothetical protein LC804_20355 [Acidobacteria bacterium]|nr:hypothetical protein [Acidobacteriota bacterium]
MFKQLAALTLLCAAVTTVASAQTKKRAGTKSVVYDITVNADTVYTGTIEMTVEGGKVTGNLHLTSPTEITGKVAGTAKGSVFKAGSRDRHDGGRSVRRAGRESDGNRGVEAGGPEKAPPLRPLVDMDAPALTIEVASRPEASDILSSPQRCVDVSYLVSIGDGEDELPVGYDNVRRKLRLRVADVVTEFGATEQDIRRIIRLAERLRSSTGTILIHCEAGVSRSSAAALIMYACWLGPGREREAMQRVLLQRPVAVPNRRMVELADTLLGRGGCLAGVLR